MKNEKRPNMRVIGDSSAGGGTYKDAKLVGNTTVNGNLDCVNFKSVGDSRINGSLEAGRLRVVGSIEVSGAVRSDDTTVTGDLKADGDISSQSLVVSGSLDTKGSVKGEQLTLRGYIGIKRTCEAERIEMAGRISIDGLLTADDIDIKAYGPSRITEIGGDRIAIRKAPGTGLAKVIRSLFVPSGVHNGIFTANSIEGDEIRLSHTRAKVVRGKEVRIGPGCEIDLVEYKDELSVDRGAQVKSKRKV